MTKKDTTSTSSRVSPKKWRKKILLLLLWKLVPKSDGKSYYFYLFESYSPKVTEKATISISLKVSPQKWQKSFYFASISLKVSPQKWQKELLLQLLWEFISKSDEKSYYTYHLINAVLMSKENPRYPREIWLTRLLKMGNMHWKIPLTRFSLL